MWNRTLPTSSVKQLCEPCWLGLPFTSAVIFVAEPAAVFFFSGAVASVLAVNENAPWLSQEASQYYGSTISQSLELLCGIELGQLYRVGGVPDTHDAVFSAGDDDCSVGVRCRAVNVV